MAWRVHAATGGVLGVMVGGVERIPLRGILFSGSPKSLEEKRWDHRGTISTQSLHF
jgi:hypothetical protein